MAIVSRRDEILTLRREAIRDIAARNKAYSIALIGSVARGEDTDASDCDFLATFENGSSLLDQAGLIIDLEKFLGCKVDVISRGGLKERHQCILADAILL
ncbi:MAG: nucleotidyltransferase domain-containing protein [Acidimicrobiia bacterium]|nr:nucleotidyltransferase domain-containing protein [Acidimicrobiia bacterium]